MGGFVTRSFECQRHNLVNQSGVEWRDVRWLGLVAQQTLDTLGHEALLSASHAGLGLRGGGHDRTGTEALIAQENDPRPPNMFVRRSARREDRLQSNSVCSRDGNADRSTHPQYRTPPPKRESAIGLFLSDQSTSVPRPANPMAWENPTPLIPTPIKASGGAVSSGALTSKCAVTDENDPLLRRKNYE